MSRNSYDAACRLLGMAPKDWNQAAEIMSPSFASDVERELDQIAVTAAMCAAYVSKRRGTDGSGSHDHSDAVKTAMARRRKIRRSLGFTYPERGEFTF